MNPFSLPDSVNISRETIEKLKTYHTLLIKWQKTVNLVSPTTITDSWQRHIVDSLQILKYIPASTKIIYDLGSGGGFPGLVIAICRPDIKVALIESDLRKCTFLKTVSRETSAGAEIKNMRIEAASKELPPPDLITARALGKITQIFDWSTPWLESNESIGLLLLKGESWQDEISDADKLYTFYQQAYPSITHKDAHIVFLENVKKRQ